MRYLDYVIKFEKESGLEIDDDMLPTKKNNFHHKFSVWLVKLLEQSDNSDYAVPPTASPKLPSWNKVYENCTDVDKSDVQHILDVIKKLGNFA